MGLGKHHSLTLNHLQGLAATQNGHEPDFQESAKRILESLQRALRFDAAWVFKFDDSLHIQNIYLHHFCQKAFSKYLDQFYTKAPLPTIHQIRNEGFVSKRGSDLIEPTTWAESPVYSEVIRPLGLRYFLTGACINEKKEYTGLVVLWKSAQRHDFSSRDCFFLEKASVHCATLLDQVKPSLMPSERPDLLRVVEQRSSPGVIILGGENEVLFVNQEAKSILDMMKSGKAFLSETDDQRFLGQLRALKEKVLRNFYFSIGANGNGSPFEIFTFRGTTYSCRGIPLEGDGSNKRSVMILIETVKEDLRPLYVEKSVSEFTAREGAVVGLIGRGLTNKEIASELGIGIHTVKDHIKNIMGKLSTHTRSGIVARTMVK